MSRPEKRFCAIIVMRAMRLSAGIIIASSPFTNLHLSLVIAGGLIALAEIIGLAEKTF